MPCPSASHHITSRSHAQVLLGTEWWQDRWALCGARRHNQETVADAAICGLHMATGGHLSQHFLHSLRQHLVSEEAQLLWYSGCSYAVFVVEHKHTRAFADELDALPRKHLAWCDAQEEVTVVHKRRWCFCDLQYVSHDGAVVILICDPATPTPHAHIRTASHMHH